MHFRAEYSIPDLVLNLKGAPELEFEFLDSLNTTVTIRTPTEQEKMGFKSHPALCTSRCQTTPTADVIAAFESLKAGRMPPDSKRDKWAATGYIAPDGTIKDNYAPGLGLMSEVFQDFADIIHGHLHRYSVLTIGVIRWRFGLEGQSKKVSSRGSYWSLDHVNWDSIPSRLGASLWQTPNFRVPEGAYEEVKAVITGLVSAGYSQPLAHELHSEARDLLNSSPRSSLVLAIAAAEVGVKQFIAEVAPDAGWLAENVPSPPLRKILKDYIPLLPTRNTITGRADIPSCLYNAIEGAAVLRNQVAHVGAPAPNSQELRRILSVVRDLLWLLDYYRGLSWALEFVSAETLNALKRVSGS